MKSSNIPRALLAIALSAGAAQAFAADLGTKAGETVENRATVSFEVNGVAQTIDVHDDATFKVDRKVDLVVSKLGDASVSPNQTGAVLTFQVQNKTNDTIDVLLSTTGGTQAFAPGTVQYFVDSATGTVGSYDTTDTATKIEDLAEDETATVFVVSNIPGTAADGETAELWLVARAANAATGTPLAETSNPDVLNTVENVFADVDADPLSGDDVDGDQDGYHAAMATYTVSTTTLTVAKRYQVIWEHVDSDGAGPDVDKNYTDVADNLKPIPGAIVQYCIQVTNGGSIDADNVTISDTLGTTSPSTAGLYADYVPESIVIASSCGTDHATSVAAYAGGTAVDDNDTDADDATTPGFGQVGSWDAGTGVVKSTVESVSATTGTTAMMFRVKLK